MKNIKVKLSLAMVGSTLALFLLTFAVINFYQQHYIFNTAISSLENELNYYQADAEVAFDNYNQGFFDVQILFLDEMPMPRDLYYRSHEENYLENLYLTGEIPYDQASKISSEFGEYYVLLTTLPHELIFDENGNELAEKEVDILLYTDITISANIVATLNQIFLAMLLLVIAVEGIIGIYLGSSFEKAQSKLNHFFQNASHELKTPLMSIQGYAEGLKTGVIDDTEMASSVIIKQSEKMRLLVDEILNLSKLDSKEYIFKTENVDIREIIDDSLENYQKLAEQKGIAIKMDISDSDYLVKADPLQLYKAVNTVIDNAFQYSDAEISLKTYAEKNFLCLEIYNSGKSIADEKIKHIFDRFYSSSAKGTGVGLAMAREIIVQSKGKIAVKNVEGGVMFLLKLVLAIDSK